jgi:hypothetical protein
LRWITMTRVAIVGARNSRYFIGKTACIAGLAACSGIRTASSAKIKALYSLDFLEPPVGFERRPADYE